MRPKLPSKQVTEIDHALAGLTVRNLRFEKNKSLRWLAKQMGFSPPFLSDLERGRRNWTLANYKKAVTTLKKLPLLNGD